MKASSRTAQPTEPEFFSRQVSEARRFYLNLQPPKSARLPVICGGLEYCTPEYAISRQSFPFHSIEYVVGGKGEVRLKNKTHTLQPGRLFSYGPGTPHEITGDPAAPLVKYFVDFSGKDASRLLDGAGLAQGQSLQIQPANALRPLFDELIRTGLESRRESAVLCSKLLECVALRMAGSRVPHTTNESRAFDTYSQCRQFIEQNYLQLQSLEQIAEQSHVDKAYLCRLFRRYDHQSPYQFLLRLKMSYAADRLQQPGALIKSVAAETGFADPFHFSRVFKSVLGLAPNSFRNLR